MLSAESVMVLMFAAYETRDKATYTSWNPIGGTTFCRRSRTKFGSVLPWLLWKVIPKASSTAWHFSFICLLIPMRRLDANVTFLYSLSILSQLVAVFDENMLIIARNA